MSVAALAASCHAAAAAVTGLASIGCSAHYTRKLRPARSGTAALPALRHPRTAIPMSQARQGPQGLLLVTATACVPRCADLWSRFSSPSSFSGSSWFALHHPLAAGPAALVVGPAQHIHFVPGIGLCRVRLHGVAQRDTATVASDTAACRCEQCRFAVPCCHPCSSSVSRARPAVVWLCACVYVCVLSE